MEQREYLQNKEHMIALAHEYARELAILIAKYDNQLRPLFSFLIRPYSFKADHSLKIDKVYELVLSDRNEWHNNGVVEL